MKILLINKYDNIGGAAVATRRLYEVLKKEDFDVKLLIQSGQNADYILSKKFIQQKKDFVKFTLGRFRDYLSLKNKKNVFYFDSASIGTNIKNHPAIKEADIIHLNWINFGFQSLKNLKQLFSLNKIIIWTLHDMWPITGGCFHSRGCNKFEQDCSAPCPFLKEKDKTARNTFYLKKQIFDYDKFYTIAISTWIQKKITRSPLIKQKPVLIPNPLNTDFYKPTDKIEAKKRLNLNPNKIHIGFVAFNISNYHKGGTFLIEALEKIKKLNKNLYNQIQLVAIGRLKQKDFFPENFDIHFTGYIDNKEKMKDFYNAFDLFVHPSLEENLPLVIQEAMACGTPVVAFPAGGIPDMIDHLTNGYLAEFKNSDDLANGIIKLLKEENLYNKIKIEARKKIVSTFSYEKVGKQIKDFYLSLR